MQDYYTLLGVPHDADAATIEAAYQRRKAEYDPERLADAAPELQALARQRQQALEQAYRVLSDTQARQRYASGSARPQRPLLTRRELFWSLGGALAALLLLAGLWYVTGQEQPLPPLIAVNQPAPGFELPLLDGGSVRLADFRGKVVLVNFWATWCGPCAEEAPDLALADRQLRDEGLVILGIDLRDTESSDAEVAKFVQRYGLEYPIALDVQAEVQRAFQIYPIPVSYFIDKQGVIRYIRNGTLTAEEIERTFRELQASPVP